MKHAVNRELFSYWNLLRSGRAAPDRSDVDPAAIRGILSDTFILEVDHAALPPRYPIRLSGTRLSALFLEDLKGHSLPGLWRRADQGNVTQMLTSVSSDCAPIVAGLRGGPEGHPPVEFELLLLPLRHHGRTHARMLGALAPMCNPSWLGLLSIQPFSLTSLRVIRDAANLERDDAWAKGSMLSRPPETAKRYGYLVVHQGGR